MGWTKWQSRRKTEAASKELLRGWTKRILSELLIFRLKHHYPQTKKVITRGRAQIVGCESAVLKIMMFRSNHLHLSDTSGMAILWEVTGGAAFSVWRSRQLDIRRWAS
jgi:hypothetical protein